MQHTMRKEIYLNSINLTIVKKKMYDQCDIDSLKKLKVKDAAT